MARRRQGRGQSVAGAVPQPQSGPGRDLGAGAFRPVAAAARARNHRIRFSWRRPKPISPSCISCANSACASRWTISAPAIPASAICEAFRSTRSRSTVPSSRISPSGRIASRSCGRSPASAAASTSPPRPKAWRPRSARLAARRRLQRGAGISVQRGEAGGRGRSSCCSSSAGAPRRRRESIFVPFANGLAKLGLLGHA